MRKIKVFICDDHTLFREGLRKLLELEDNLQVVGEAGSGAEVIEKIKGKAPDIVLMDIGMPGMDGVQSTHRIIKDHPEVKVIILTVHDDESHIFEAIKAGASGYLLKEVSSRKLVEAIHAVFKGGVLLEPKIAGRVLHEFSVSSMRRITDENVYRELTGREKEVLKLIALGGSNREIAEKLEISEKTVKNHISVIFQKLHVNNRTQAALYVFREKKL